MDGENDPPPIPYDPQRVSHCRIGLSPPCAFKKHPALSECNSGDFVKLPIWCPSICVPCVALAFPLFCLLFLLGFLRFRLVLVAASVPPAIPRLACFACFSFGFPYFCSLSQWLRPLRQPFLAWPILLASVMFSSAFGLSWWLRLLRRRCLTQAVLLAFPSFFLNFPPLVISGRLDLFGCPFVFLSFRAVLVAASPPLGIPPPALFCLLTLLCCRNSARNYGMF